MTATTLAAEQAARTSYGRLLALLVARSRDIAAAEDALSDAFASALSTWPVRGVPENPDAWLLTAARNKEKNRFRHQQVRDASREELERRAIDRALDEATTTAIEIPDERLRFMLVCTHPAIDQAARTPLMLQTVLGLDARRIADAFLVAPTTMGQRLVRAKARIKDAGVRMTLPTPEELPTRIDDILGAVYAAYATGHDDVTGADEAVTGLTAEAIFLARLVVSLLPGEPEAWGLLSLLLACEARRGARLDDEGHFVPLLEQDPTRWSRPLLREAESALRTASTAARFGRFQCEAAIQSLHVERRFTGEPHREALRTLYDLLLAHAPSLGAAIARAAAIADAGEPDEALKALRALPDEAVRTHQPYWVTLSSVLHACGDVVGALAALDRAIGLTVDPGVRTFLRRRRERFSGLSSTDEG